MNPTAYIAVKRSSFYGSADQIDWGTKHAPDVGLLELVSDAQPQPAVIQSQPYVTSGPGDLLMMGYGPKAYSGIDGVRDLLSVAQLTSLPAVQCQTVNPRTFDPAFEICGGPAEGFASGACPGDSGGGALDSSGKVVAVNSWGLDNCGLVEPADRRTAFSRVHNALDWLLSQTGQGLADIPAQAQDLRSPSFKKALFSYHSNALSSRIDYRFLTNDQTGGIEASGQLLFVPLGAKQNSLSSAPIKAALDAVRGSWNVPGRWSKNTLVKGWKIQAEFYLRNQLHNTSSVYQISTIVRKNR